MKERPIGAIGAVRARVGTTVLMPRTGSHAVVAPWRGTQHAHVSLSATRAFKPVAGIAMSVPNASRSAHGECRLPAAIWIGGTVVLAKSYKMMF